MKNLKEKYAQLFEGKSRSNDIKLINEAVSTEDIVADGMDQLETMIDSVMEFDGSVMSTISDDERFDELSRRGSQLTKSIIQDMEQLLKLFKSNL
jgi:hypothetical protein